MNGRIPAPVIAIDGPVGSGKGTVAARLAGRLGWHLLDSGALYRLLALAAIDRQLDAAQEGELAQLARALDFEFRFDGKRASVFLGGREVSRAIRGEQVGLMASRIASLPTVRSALVERQRAFRKAPGLVADGRDMGTIIFPDAVVKIYLTADVETRARRRYKQLKEKGESVNLSRLFREVETRDERDSSREVAPLRPAADAIILDSTDLNINEVVQKVYTLAEERQLIN